MKENVKVSSEILNSVREHVKKTKQTVGGFYDLAAESFLSAGLNPSEAVYGFAAWLTTRKEITKMGSSCDCAPIVELVDKFCKENKLPAVRDWYHKKLKHPKP